MPSFIAPIQMMLPELSSPHEVLFQPKAEGYIVPRASHKTVTSSACRDTKLLAIQQAESEFRYKISYLKSQRMPGGVGAGGLKPPATRLCFLLIFGAWPEMWIPGHLP